MAEKMSTLIIESDLECEKCYRKIQKVLRKLQEKENIRSIKFDTKKNMMTIAGPFDPVKLSWKLRCKSSEAIKDITIVEEKNPEEEKPKEEPEPAPSTTVNLQFTDICNLCYPWPCSDPSNWCGVHRYPQPQAPPQWAHELPVAMPTFHSNHHQPYPPWSPATPKRQPCGGPSYCGGCGSCGGWYNGWPPAMPTPLQMMQPPPMIGCRGQATSCSGCKGCRIVQEGRFIYEEYSPTSCTVM